MSLQKLKDMSAKAAFGITRNEAWEKRICIRCKVLPQFYTQAGIREYGITALCEFCFDLICQPSEECCKTCDMPPSFHQYKIGRGECKHFVPRTDIDDIISDED